MEQARKTLRTVTQVSHTGNLLCFFPYICVFKVFCNKVFFKTASKSNCVCLVIVVALIRLRCDGALALAEWGLRADVGITLAGVQDDFWTWAMFPNISELLPHLTPVPRT